MSQEKQAPDQADDGTALLAPRAWWQNRGAQFGIVATVLVVVIVAIVKGGGTSQGWVATGGSGGGHALALLIDPAHGGALLAGNEAGQVLTSTDGGQTWQAQAGGLPPGIAVSALLATASADHIYAGTSAGIYLSTDNAQHWVASSAGIPHTEGVDALVFGSADDRTVLAGTEQGGVYLSRDGGATWAASNNGLPAGADIYSLMAGDNSAIFAGLIGAGVYLSRDGGATWAASNNGLPAGANAFTFAGATDLTTSAPYLLVGTDRGLFLSKDDGATWALSDGGMGLTRVISLAVAPLSSSDVVAGTDNGVFESFNGGLVWTTDPGSPTHVGAVAVTSDNPKIIYAAADKVYRFPGASALTVLGLARFLGLGIVVALLLWVWGRNQRIVREMTATRESTLSPYRAAKQNDATKLPASEAARRPPPGHIRGGPPPRPPVDPAA